MQNSVIKWGGGEGEERRNRRVKKRRGEREKKKIVAKKRSLAIGIHRGMYIMNLQIKPNFLMYTTTYQGEPCVWYTCISNI